MALRQPVPHPSEELYERDFFAWTQRTAELMRNGRLDEVDVSHLAEEVEDLGKRDRRECLSRLRVLLKHLAKWRLQPERRLKSTWLGTINTQRSELLLLFRDSPSLRRHATAQLSSIYAQAIRQALEETRSNQNPFPPDCAFTLEQILDPKFF